MNAERFSLFIVHHSYFIVPNYETTISNRIYIRRVPDFSRLFGSCLFGRFELCRDDRGLFDLNFFGSYLDIIFGKGEKGKSRIIKKLRVISI